MYRQLDKIEIPNKRAKLLLEKIIKLSIKKGYCYAGNDMLAKIMCCSIRTIERALSYLRQNEYVLIEYQQRKVALIYPNLEKIGQTVDKMADQEQVKNLDPPIVDKSVDKPVDKSILDPPFCRIKIPPIMATVNTNPCREIGILVGERAQPFLQKKLHDSHYATPSSGTKNLQITTAIPKIQSLEYACSGLYKKMQPPSSNSQIDIIANIVKFYNECTQNKLSYNAGFIILKNHVENGLTYENAIKRIRDRMFKFKQKECDEVDLQLNRIFRYFS